jgi:hypothetical protein
MAVPLAVSCPRSGHACHVIRSRYRISVTSLEGRLAWRPREGCGPTRAGSAEGRPFRPARAASGYCRRRRSSGGRTGRGCRPSPSTTAACPGRCRGSLRGPRASAPRCTRAASCRPGRRRRRTVRFRSLPSLVLAPPSDPSGSSLSHQRCGVMTVPSARVNSCRWLRSQRAKASLIAVASCSNVAEREAIKTRPGRGHRSPECEPCTSSTVIARCVRPTGNLRDRGPPCLRQSCASRL